MIALNEIQQIPERMYSMYCKYHSTVLHKLRSSMFFLGEIEKLVLQPTHAASGSRADRSEVVDWEFDFPTFSHEINRNLDCFFSSVRSSLDVLTREVLCFFDLVGTNDIYFGCEKGRLNQAHKGQWLILKLKEPTWFKPFNYYRNMSTHEEIISEEVEVIYFPLNGSRAGRRINVPLPPNPRGRIPSTKRNVDSYCNYIFINLLKHISPIYGAIMREVKTTQTMPLQ